MTTLAPLEQPGLLAIFYGRRDKMETLHNALMQSSDFALPTTDPDKPATNETTGVLVWHILPTAAPDTTVVQCAINGAWAQSRQRLQAVISNEMVRSAAWLHVCLLWHVQPTAARREPFHARHRASWRDHVRYTETTNRPHTTEQRG